MTPADLAAIRARLEAATPGPWTAKSFDPDDQFIAHAPSDIAALLAEVERLRRLVEEAYIEGCLHALKPGNKGLSQAEWNKSNAKARLEAE